MGYRFEEVAEEVLLPVFSGEDVRIPPGSGPIAGFNVVPSSGLEPLSCAFSNTTSGGSATSFYLDVRGDGTVIDNGPIFSTYVFSAWGVYTAKLTVDGPGGRSSAAHVIDVQTSAPIANFSAAPTSGLEPLGVKFTNKSSGVISAYLWTFGDGGSAATSEISYTYGAYGSYHASCLVTGPGGSDSWAVDIIVSAPAPVAAFQALPTSGEEILTVSFVNKSSGYITSEAIDYTGSGVFTPTSNFLDHAYSYGSWPVEVYADGPGGSSRASQVINVTASAPTAAFTALPSAGEAPILVTFTNSCAGRITSFYLDVKGTGSTIVTGSNFSTFSFDYGNYTAKLTVDGPGGTDSAVASLEFSAAKPVADFSALTLSGTAPLIVTFANHSSGLVDSIHWDVRGDSTVELSAYPTSTFSFGSAGTFSSLLVLSGPGGSARAGQVISVAEVSIPEIESQSVSLAVISRAAGYNFIFTDLDLGSYSSMVSMKIIATGGGGSIYFEGRCGAAGISTISLGTEMIPHPDLGCWSGDDPCSWEVGNETSVNLITEYASGQMAIFMSVGGPALYGRIFAGSADRAYFVSMYVFAVVGSYADHPLRVLFYEVGTGSFSDDIKIYGNGHKEGYLNCNNAAGSNSIILAPDGAPINYGVQYFSVKPVDGPGPKGLHITDEDGSAGWVSMVGNPNEIDTVWVVEA